MFFHNKKQTPKEAARYKIKAVLSKHGHVEIVETDDYATGETWIHVTARRLRKIRMPKETLVISMFDTTVKRGSNLVAQYSKTDAHEEFKSLVSDTL